MVAWFGEEIKEFGVAPFGVGEAHVWGRGVLKLLVVGCLRGPVPMPAVQY